MRLNNATKTVSQLWPAYGYDYRSAAVIEQCRDELQGPLMTYNRRIKALQSDMARTLDGEWLAILEERLNQA